LATGWRGWRYVLSRRHLIEVLTVEQPTPADRGRAHLPAGDEPLQLALADAEIVGGFRER
jgi:hypothetical protein